jgi:hypothetical protein
LPFTSVKRIQLLHRYSRSSESVIAKTPFTYSYRYSEAIRHKPSHARLRNRCGFETLIVRDRR